MSAEPLRLTPINLRQRYSSWMVWHIWRAVRAEWGKVGGGRDSFAAHVDDVVMSTSNRQPIIFEDGTPYEFPDSPPGSKTIYNFVHSIDSAAMFRLIDGEPKASISTLQYLHLYLWRTNPKRTAFLDAASETALKAVDLSGLDSTFERLRPTALIASPHFLYRTRGRVRDFAYLIKNGIEAKTLAEMQWTRVGAIAVLPTDDPFVGQIYMVGARASQELFDEMAEQKEAVFTKEAALLSGPCIVFMSKNFSHRDSVPSITEDEGILVAECEAQFSGATKSVSVCLSNPKEGFSWFERKDIMDAMLGISFIGAFDEWSNCVPLPMEAAQAARFHEVCASIG